MMFMLDQIWNYMTKKDSSIQCCFCGRIFICIIKPENLLRHLLKNHVDEKDQAVKDDSMKESNDQNEAKLIEEQKDVTESNLTLPEKEDNNKTSSSYWKYFKKIPEDPSKATCIFCQTQVTVFTYEQFNQKYLLAHLRKFHRRLVREKKYLCSHCGKQYHHSQRKMECEARCTGDSRLKCPYDGCSMQFTMFHSVNKHISSVHKKLKPHICDTCGRAFAQGQQLKTHSRVHTGETPFECVKCHKKFKFYATRNSHKCVPT